MSVKTVKRLNRAQRLHRLLRTRWLTSWEIIHGIGTVKPTNAIHELRKAGVEVKSRRNSNGLYEYRVAKS